MLTSEEKKELWIVRVLIFFVVLLFAFWLFPKVSRPNKRFPASNTCIAWLKQLSGAKEQWALDNRKAKGDLPDWTDIVGERRYIKISRACPAGGIYSLNPVGQPPTCSVGTNDSAPHVLSPLITRE